MWKTEDAGTHFEPIFDKYGNMSMGSLGIAASDPKVLYLGTGEPMHARSSSHGNGVWKSVDAGKTWTNVGLAKSYFIPKVQVDPKNPDVVYVAAEGKLYDNETDSERGFYVTTDGGKTWERRWPLADRGVGEFVVDPRDFNVVIAQAYKLYRRAWTYIDRQPGNHLYKTTDGGKTWKKLTQGLPTAIDAGRAGLAIYLKNPDIVYARIDEEVNLGLAERDGGSNFRAPMGTGGMGFGGGGNYAENKSFDSWKAHKIDPLLAKQAPKFAPIVAADEAELVKKLNEHIADKDFLTKSGIDLAAFNAAARKVHAKNKDLVAAIDEIEKLQKREAPKADSAEAKGRARSPTATSSRCSTAASCATSSRSSARASSTGRPTSARPGRKMTEYKLTGGSALVNQTEAGYYARLYVDAQNDQTLYAVDTNTTVSTDGGKTFKATGWDAGAYKLHVDHRALWLDPQNSNHIMSGNDGGAGETWDGGKHWHQKSTISAQQFYDVAADNEQPYNVMGGTQDNGAWWGPSQNRNSVGRLRRRLELPADGRRLLRRPRLVEPRLHVLREPVRGLEPHQPRDRRDLGPGQADDRRGAGQGHAGPALPVERPDRAFAPQPRHRLHLLAVRPPLPQPGRAGHLRHHQPGPVPGRQDAPRGVEEDQPPVRDDLHVRRVGQEAGPLLGRDRRRQRPDVARRRRHLEEHHGRFLRHEDGQGQARRQGRPHPVRPLGEEGRPVAVRRERLLRRLQRLPDPQRGQDLDLRHPRPGQDLGGHLRRHDEPRLGPRGGPRQRRRPLRRHGLRRPRHPRQGQDLGRRSRPRRPT